MAGDSTPEELQLVCQEWCGSSTTYYKSQITSGDPLCCSSEIWEDGETNCYLYMGKQGMEYVPSGAEVISMMDFTYGSEASAFALKTTFGALAAIAVIMQ